jgi:2-succinyl-6-hydroxy-2,4-cyclohexadiene-1-carboxylate synthase
VVRVDLPGHGRSGDVRATFDEAASMIGDAGGAATYVGYSLGGRLCLRLAVDRPDLVRALVLVSASPGIADDAEREVRRAADDALADDIERDGVQTFLERWLAQPMFAGVSPDEAGRRAIQHTAQGLANALRSLGAGVMDPLWDRLGRLAMPLQLVAGDRDPRYVDIARAVRAAVPGAQRIAVVPGAGHACHLERPDMVAGVIERFMVRHAAFTS